MQVDVEVTEDLQNRWTHLEQQRASYVGLCEQYAKWTLPYLFPSGSPGSSANVEMQLSADSIGAQAVNHLANKVVSTLFPPQSMFFRLRVDALAKSNLVQTLAQQGADEPAVAAAIAEIDKQLAAKEKEAQDKLDMVSFRPQAVRAAQLLIITGNALEFHPEGRPVQVFSLRDYCVVRDLSGEVIEIMTRECKAFETFHPNVQAQLKDPRIPKSHRSEYAGKTEVVVYTQIRLENDGKFHVVQSADHVKLDIGNASYPKDKLPWIVLTWNLVRGEDYGRGLVGDYSGAFHAINVLTLSLLNIAAIMGDIKFLVNPSSMLDVQEMNQSQPGSYHSGKEGDVTTVKLDRYNEAQFISNMIERYERQIGQAFLLATAVTRNAERVTAEEIRDQANELETSNGGIYSRLAANWQSPLAYVILDQIDFQAVEHGITPKVITGMDSLSRMSELDNLKMFFMDLAMLNNLPEDVRAEMDLQKVMSVLGTNRQVEYQAMLKTKEQKQQEYQQAMQMQQAQAAQEASGKVAAAAGTEAVKQAA